MRVSFGGKAGACNWRVSEVNPVAFSEARVLSLLNSLCIAAVMFLLRSDRAPVLFWWSRGARTGCDLGGAL